MSRLHTRIAIGAGIVALGASVLASGPSSLVGAPKPIAAVSTSLPEILRYSTSAGRGSPQALSGATLCGRVYVFAVPNGNAPVEFHMDGDWNSPVTKREESTPYDLVGDTSTGKALPLDLVALGAGPHKLGAMIVSPQGEKVWAEAAFNVCSPTTTTTAAPATTTTAAPAPTTTAAPATTTTAAPATTTTAAPTTTTTAAPTTTTTAAPAPSSAWPGATNTGIPAGTTLTPSGSITVTTPGTVIDAKDISGSLTIAANNVTVKRTRVRGSNWTTLSIKEGLTGVVIQDCEIDGKGLSGSEGSMGIMGPGTFLRNNVYGVENGITPANGSLVQDNWIHNLGAPGAPHYDSIQIDGGSYGSNITIRHNTIENQFGQTSAVMIDNYFGSVSNVVVDNNILRGGGFTVYSDGQFNGGTISGVKFTNNRLKKGYYGYASIVKNSPTVSGNVDDVTGNAISF